MPFHELKLYMDEYDLIKVEESMNSVNNIAMGNGLMKEESHTKIVDNWQQIADLSLIHI